MNIESLTHFLRDYHRCSLRPIGGILGQLAFGLYIERTCHFPTTISFLIFLFYINVAPPESQPVEKWTRRFCPSPPIVQYKMDVGLHTTDIEGQYWAYLALAPMGENRVPNGYRNLGACMSKAPISTVVSFTV